MPLKPFLTGFTLQANRIEARHSISKFEITPAKRHLAMTEAFNLLKASTVLENTHLCCQKWSLDWNHKSEGTHFGKNISFI